MTNIIGQTTSAAAHSTLQVTNQIPVFKGQPGLVHSDRMKQVAETIAMQCGVNLYQEMPSIQIGLKGKTRYKELTIRGHGELRRVSVYQEITIRGEQCVSPYIDFCFDEHKNWYAASLHYHLAPRVSCLKPGSDKPPYEVIDVELQHELAAFADSWADELVNEYWLDKGIIRFACRF